MSGNGFTEHTTTEQHWLAVLEAAAAACAAGWAAVSRQAQHHELPPGGVRGSDFYATRELRRADGQHVSVELADRRSLGGIPQGLPIGRDVDRPQAVEVALVDNRDGAGAVIPDHHHGHRSWRSHPVAPATCRHRAGAAGQYGHKSTIHGHFRRIIWG